jgi:hypothetical protein
MLLVDLETVVGKTQYQDSAFRRIYHLPKHFPGVGFTYSLCT